MAFHIIVRTQPLCTNQNTSGGKRSTALAYTSCQGPRCFELELVAGLPSVHTRAARFAEGLVPVSWSGTAPGMVRPLDKPRKSSSKITSLIRTLSRRKGKAVSDQDQSIVLLNLPDAVLENILVQAHPITALALGSTCKHLKAEYTRHRPQISLKLLSQPENHVAIAPASDIKVRSTRKSKTGPATLGAYLVQRSFTYQLVVRNQWSVRSGEVLLHMLLTQQADSEQVWSALLPSLQAEKQMYQDSIDNCVGAEGIDYSRLWDVTVSIRVAVTLSKAEFDALVPCCQPFVARVRTQLAEVTNRDVEDMQLRILFESVNWYRVFRSA